MAVKKPKKLTVTAPKKASSKAVLAPPKFVATNAPKFTLPRAAPKPTQPATPAPPVQAPVPTAPVVTGPPRPSMNTATDRESAMRRYIEAMNEVNSQIRDLAANYGGASKVTQYGYTPGGADSQSELDMVTNQPGTQLEVLLRNLNANKGHVNDSYLAGGAFLGTQRVGKLGELDTGYASDLSAAQRAYQQAIAAIDRQLGAERGDRNEALTRADIEDILAASATAPEWQRGNEQRTENAIAAPAQAALVTPKPVAVAPSTKPQVLSSKRQGGFKEYRNNHGSLVRQFDNGKKYVLVNGVWKLVK